MDNDLVFGQGKCEKHGTTWRVLNNGLSGCVVCDTENFIEKTKIEMKENLLKQIKAIEWALLTP